MIMPLRDYLIPDLNVFMNLDEFAELHSIDGVELPVIIDNDRLRERTQKEFNGISIGELLIFVKKDDLEKRPEIGRPMRFDKRQMYVADCIEDMGVYEIILTQNRSGR